MRSNLDSERRIEPHSNVAQWARRLLLAQVLLNPPLALASRGPLTQLHQDESGEQAAEEGTTGDHPVKIKGKIKSGRGVEEACRAWVRKRHKNPAMQPSLLKERYLLHRGRRLLVWEMSEPGDPDKKFEVFFDVTPYTRYFLPHKFE